MRMPIRPIWVFGGDFSDEYSGIVEIYLIEETFMIIDFGFVASFKLR